MSKRLDSLSGKKSLTIIVCTDYDRLLCQKGLVACQVKRCLIIIVCYVKGPGSLSGKMELIIIVCYATMKLLWVIIIIG